MEIFKKNTYIELFNPAENNYFPVRIIEKKMKMLTERLS